MKTRNELPAMLNERNLTGIGVEIGVQEGNYSYEILSRSKLRTVYSVDAWMQGRYGGVVAQEVHDYRYLKTIIKLMPFGNRSVCIRQESEDAVKLFRNESLDFIYIDARHEYDFVIGDIALWWPKMKKGGIFAGHDYLEGSVEQTDPTGKFVITDWFGVKRAVDEHARKYNLEVHFSDDGIGFKNGGEFPSWYIIC